LLLKFTILYICYRPRNREELFNLRHASARNVIERIFGVVKRRFRILLIAPEYSLDIQARIPAALCAIHNFNRTHDAEDIVPEIDIDNGNPNDHDYVASAAAAVQLDHPSEIRDLIAQQMWEDYVSACNERGLDGDDQSSDEDEWGEENSEGGDDGDDSEDYA
jgi:DDE superfamily endonuclease